LFAKFSLQFYGESMHTQALPGIRLVNRGWRRPPRHLNFRARSGSRPARPPRPAQPAQPAQWQDVLRSRPVLRRRAGLVALAVGGVLLPWMAVLGAVLPATAQAQHWALAWTGLDGAEAAAALVTALLLSRGDRRASLSAGAGGTLLLIDAWFDVCTSAPGAGHAIALAEAGCAELPLAVAAWWVAIALTRQTR
jgi:hypothetical protein